MATVIIVDDDKYTRNVLQGLLAQDHRFASLELVTHVCENAERGLQAFRAHRPDVIIVDLLMPGMDGFALCSAIREDPAGKDVHLFVMSGIYRDAAVARKIKTELGAQFFAKPYQLREMLGHLAALLGRSTAPRRRQTDTPSPLALTESSGELSQRPVPALLFDFLEAKASGHLTLRRGRITKVIELVVGHPLSVSSTARDETLGHFLVSFGAISEADHKRALERAAENKEKVADALLALGLMTPEELVTRLSMHTCYKVMQSLRWPDGAWQFQPHDQPRAGMRGNPIDIVSLVLQGLGQTAPFDSIPERVAAIQNNPLELSERGKALLPAVRHYLSKRFVEVWADGASVASLLATGLERSELYITLEALLFCDALGPAVPGARASARSSTAATLQHAYPQDSMLNEAWDDFSVEELSRHSTARFLRPAELSQTGQLYSMLFDDVGGISLAPSGDLPIELPDEDPTGPGLGSVSELAAQDQLGSAAPTPEEVNFARRVLLKEYLRVQGLDHYGVLRIPRQASTSEVADALAMRKNKLSVDWFARYDLGRDYAKLEEIHAAYDRAAQVLLDEDKRQAYDRSLDGDDLEQSNEPNLDAEIAFHAGQDLLQHGSYEGAVQRLQAAVAAAPDEADYHAALGWAFYLKGGRSPRAADLARPHLNQGLAINPDHAPSHEHKGQISAELGTDSAEAIFHLERALDTDVTRAPALEALERIWLQRGQLRPLERQYRRMIYRCAGSEPALELALWLRLAELYRTQLGELDNARIAYQSAARLAPEEPRIRMALEVLASATADRFLVRAEMLRSGWQQNPLSADPGIKLMSAAIEANRPDAAYLAASALIARGMANPEAEELYQRHRPRFLIRAQRPLTGELWDKVRHEDDLSELGALFELLAPVIETSLPLGLEDLELDEAMEVAEDELPETFVRVRAYVAQMLGVAAPRVFVRSDFGHQIHIGALPLPLLLAGDEALTSPERSELSFRLGRAMTYLMPGRAFAGSRPGRLLKAAVLAICGTMSPDAPISDPEGYVATVQAALGQLSPAALTTAQAQVAQIMAATRTLDLSRWARALSSTADRVGFLLSGDLPAAVRFIRDGSSTRAVDDLIDFALSHDCWHLRAQIGLSIDV